MEQTSEFLLSPPWGPICSVLRLEETCLEFAKTRESLCSQEQGSMSLQWTGYQEESSDGITQ